MRRYLYQGLLALALFAAASEGMTFMMESALQAQVDVPVSQHAQRLALAIADELRALPEDSQEWAPGELTLDDPGFTRLAGEGVHYHPAVRGAGWRVVDVATPTGLQRTAVVMVGYEIGAHRDQVTVWLSRPVGALTAAR